MSELRYNPLLGEWVATATHRQERTFLPPANFCPLCPTTPGGFPTEVPDKSYDLVVFANRFPSLTPDPPEPAVQGTDLTPVERACGVCEVILYSPRHDATLASEPLEQFDKLIYVWKDRTAELGKLEFVDYVFVFENKGEAIGVTLHHPHGQVYGYPFIPPVIRKELDNAERHRASTGRCLFCDVLNQERADGRRIVLENESFTAYVPFFARWPYEVHVMPRRHVGFVTELDRAEHLDFARLLKSLLVGFDGLFDRSFPYMMVLHQRPTDGQPHEGYHFHVEFYPPLRTANKLKYLAGSETGAGMFINDTLAEEKAAELRASIEKTRGGDGR